MNKIKHYFSGIVVGFIGFIITIWSYYEIFADGYIADAQGYYHASFALLISLMIFWVYIFLNIRTIISLEKNNKELNFVTEKFKDVQRIAKMASWEKNLKTKEYYFSDELRTILCLEEGDSEIYSVVFHPKKIHLDDFEKLLNARTEYNKNYTPYDLIYRLNHNGSTIIINEKCVAQFNSKNEAIETICTLQDVTEKYLTEEKIKSAYVVFNTTSECILITDTSNRITAVNEAFEYITGYSSDEVIGKNPKILSSGMHDKDFFYNFWKELSLSGKWQGELICTKKNGENYPQWSRISVIKESEKVLGYVSVFSDIGKIKNDEEILYKLAYRDMVTGLPNRLLFEEELRSAIKRASFNNKKIALLEFGLERFKHINDLFGYKVGDELLIAVSQRVKEKINESDIVARFGGDEFVVMIENFDNIEDIGKAAENILNIFSIPFNLNLQKNVFSSASMGISVFPNDGITVSELLKKSNSSLLYAKNNRRNNYHYYSENISLDISKRLNIENRLRHAINNKSFTLMYQPQYDVSNRKLLGVEALIRWKDEELGVVFPDIFIPLAEEIGLINEIGLWVIEKACQQIKVWDKMGLPSFNMAINISAKQLEKENFHLLVNEIINKYGINPSLLDFEITETAIMSDPEQALEMLGKIKNLGTMISVDDFGVGYSSLNYLKKMNVDKIKIDRSFVSGIPHDTQDVEIISAIINMAKALHVDVLAEGVETPQQLEFLMNHGCYKIQGYLFSTPISPEDFNKDYLFIKINTIA